MRFWNSITDAERRAWERLEQACRAFDRAGCELAAARRGVVEAAGTGRAALSRRRRGAPPRSDGPGLSAVERG
jgi:hypothetical protein